jgi:hypothetical protein
VSRFLVIVIVAVCGTVHEPVTTRPNLFSGPSIKSVVEKSLGKKPTSFEEAKFRFEARALEFTGSVKGIRIADGVAIAVVTDESQKEGLSDEVIREALLEFNVILQTQRYEMIKEETDRRMLHETIQQEKNTGKRLDSRSKNDSNR